MTHEPECTVIFEVYQENVTSASLRVIENGCVCENLRSAYQRGRDKAADAIAAEYERRKPEGRVESYRDGFLDGLDIAESLARGGEQE